MCRGDSNASVANFFNGHVFFHHIGGGGTAARSWIFLESLVAKIDGSRKVDELVQYWLTSIYIYELFYSSITCYLNKHFLEVTNYDNINKRYACIVLMRYLRVKNLWGTLYMVIDIELRLLLQVYDYL